MAEFCSVLSKRTFHRQPGARPSMLTLALQVATPGGRRAASCDFRKIWALSMCCKGPKRQKLLSLPLENRQIDLPRWGQFQQWALETGREDQKSLVSNIVLFKDHKPEWQMQKSCFGGLSEAQGFFFFLGFWFVCFGWGCLLCGKTCLDWSSLFQRCVIIP